MSGCCQVLVPVPVPVPVPDSYRYRGLAASRRVCISLSFGHNWALLCTAVCSTNNVTSGTGGCVLLFNGDVQTANVLSQYKCRLNTFNWLLNKESFGADLSLPCKIIYRLFNFEAWYQRCVSKTHSNSIWLVNAQIDCNNCTLQLYITGNYILLKTFSTHWWCLIRSSRNM